MSFSLASVIQTGAAVLRVTFTDAMPLSASSQGANDALNKFNWKLQGPTEVTVGAVRTVSADPFSFDLVCESALVSGTWTLNAGDIRTPFGVSVDVNSLQFVSNGAQQYFNVPLSAMTSETVVRQALNAALDGPGWKALVAALGYSDQKNTELAMAAAFQKNLATATGTYLENITTSYGVDKKADVGITDDTLRALTLGLNANKVNTLGLEAILQAYYGDDATIAHATSGTAQPYVVNDGDNLIFEVDNVNVLVAFAASDFRDPTAASAQEIATVINRELKLLGMAALATEFIDPNTGLTHLRIYSGQNGIKGYLRFHGGSLDATLQFPTIVPTTQIPNDTEWFFETNLDDPTIPYGSMCLIYDGGTNPTLINVFVGDYLNLYGDQISVANHGTWKVTAVDVNDGRIEFESPLEPDSQGHSDFTPTDNTQLFFTRPTVIRLQANNVAFVSQASPGTSEIVLAATTVAVGRSLKTAWYLNGCAPIALLTSDGDTYPTNFRTGFSQGGAPQGADADLVTIKTVTPHGLTVGRYFFLDDLKLANSDVTIDDVTTIGITAPNLFGRWNPCTGGYLGWGTDTSTFKFLAADASSVTDLGNAGIGSSSGPTMVSLNADQVLIVSDSTALIYVASANTFTTVASPPNTKVSGTAPFGSTLLNDGRAMVIGRDANNILRSDVYSPSLGNWGTSFAFPASNTYFIGTSYTPSPSISANSVAWSGPRGIFCAVVSGSAQVYISSDGVNWTHNTAPGGALSWQTIIWASGVALFIAASGDGHIMTSPDGVNWTARTSPSVRNWTAISHSPDLGITVLLASDGTAANQGAYSRDGITWTTTSTTHVQQWSSVTWSAKRGLFLAVCLDGTGTNQTMVSANGTIWIHGGTPAPTAAWQVVKWSPDLNIFVMMSNDSTGYYAVSSDGLTWTVYGSSGHWTSLIWVSEYGIFVAFSHDVSNQMWTSSDGVNWSSHATSGANLTYTALTYSPKLGMILSMSQNNFVSTVNSFCSETNYAGALTAPDGYAYYLVTNASPTPIAFVYSPLEDSWSNIVMPTVSNEFFSWAYIDDGTPRGSIWISTNDNTRYIFQLNLASNSVSKYPLPNFETPTAFRVIATPTKEVALIPVGNTGDYVGIINPRAPVSQSTRFIQTPGPPDGGTNDQFSGPLLLSDGRIVYTNFQGGEFLSLNIYSKYQQQSGGGLANRILKVTDVTDAQTLSFRTPEFPYRTRITAGTLTPILPETQSLASGYMLDSTEGVSLADVQTTTTVVVAGGVGPRILNVASTVGIPDAVGYITLAFGQDNQSLPIRYTGVASSTQLLLDPSAVLAQRYPAGTTVDLLTARGPFAPADSTPYGVTWLTSSVIGRLAAETDLAFAQGAGLNITTTVVYPGDRGLGNEGQPTHGIQKITDAVYVWGSDDIDAELIIDRETT